MSHRSSSLTDSLNGMKLKRSSSRWQFCITNCDVICIFIMIVSPCPSTRRHALHHIVHRHILYSVQDSTIQCSAPPAAPYQISFQQGNTRKYSHHQTDRNTNEDLKRLHRTSNVSTVSEFVNRQSVMLCVWHTSRTHQIHKLPFCRQTDWQTDRASLFCQFVSSCCCGPYGHLWGDSSKKRP